MIVFKKEETGLFNYYEREIIDIETFTNIFLEVFKGSKVKLSVIELLPDGTVNSVMEKLTPTFVTCAIIEDGYFKLKKEDGVLLNSKFKNIIVNNRNSFKLISECDNESEGRICIQDINIITGD